MKLPIKQTVITLVTLIVLLAIAVWLYRQVNPSLRDSADPLLVETLANARAVEVFRVASEPSADAKDTISGFPILARGPSQGSAFAKRLSEVLLSRGVRVNYKKCGMYPGVAFRVSDGINAADVLVCFECDVLACVTQGAEVTASDYQAFDSVRETMVKLAKESLPEDEAIQNLPLKIAKYGAAE